MLFIIAEHYMDDDPSELENLGAINGIPQFFSDLTDKEKSEYCYNQITEILSLEANPVTIESLRATKRNDPDDPYSSYAGAFVRKVTLYVTTSLAFLIVVYVVFYHWLKVLTLQGADGLTPGDAIQWIGLGCVGALIHLLNHALTTTRLQTFEVSETRKIWPRILLGGMFGFVIPWIIHSSGFEGSSFIAVSSVSAFFAGYSVRFSLGLLERLLQALLPETKPKP